MSTLQRVLLIFVLIGSVGFAIVTPSEVVAEMEHGVHHLLGSLDHHQREAATFTFDDEERYNFHFVPRERKGVALKAMSPAQKKMAQALLATALSSRGMRTVESTMYLEQILYELENQNPIRDPDLYFVSIFGMAGAKSWGWRFEGHHLSLNFTIHEGELVSATPAFFGSNPAEVRSGAHQGLRVLDDREDWARSILSFLDQDLLQKVVVNAEAPRDILSGAQRQAAIYRPPGVPVAELPVAARESFRKLLAAYSSQFTDEITRKLFWERVNSEGESGLHFAWAGGVERGDLHYYRIQGKSFLIEYDNTQNGGNHVHSVWRDLERDFGGDPLAEHLEHEH